MDITTPTAVAAAGGWTSGGSPRPLPADEPAQDLLREALGEPAPALPASGGTPHDAPLAPPVVGGSLGDAVLSGLNKLSGEFQDAWAQKNAILAKGPEALSAGDALRLQAAIGTTSAVIDVVSKGVSKVVQGIEQLTKVQ